MCISTAVKAQTCLKYTTVKVNTFVLHEKVRILLWARTEVNAHVCVCGALINTLAYRIIHLPWTFSHFYSLRTEMHFSDFSDLLNSACLTNAPLTQSLTCREQPPLGKVTAVSYSLHFNNGFNGDLMVYEFLLKSHSTC